MAGQLKRTMMDMAAEQSPEYAAQLAKADDAFKNMAVIDRAGARAEDFTPKQLEAAIKANDTTARKNAFAQGRGPMRDLSKAGADILSNTVPDSGTISRGQTQAGAIGGGAYNPAVIAPALAAYKAQACRINEDGTEGNYRLARLTLAKGGEKVAKRDSWPVGCFHS